MRGGTVRKIAVRYAVPEVNVPYRVPDFLYRIRYYHLQRCLEMIAPYVYRQSYFWKELIIKEYTYLVTRLSNVSTYVTTSKYNIKHPTNNICHNIECNIQHWQFDFSSTFSTILKEISWSSGLRHQVTN